MNGLVINTASEMAHIVLLSDEKRVGEKVWDNNPRVGVEVLIALEELLVEADMSGRDLNRIGVHVGPSRWYSSLRAGVTAASVLSFALAIELVELTDSTFYSVESSIWELEPSFMVQVRYVEKNA